MNKKVFICFLLFAFFICLIGIKNSFALDNNGYFFPYWNILGNISWNNIWGNYGTVNPSALGTPTWNMIGEITSWNELGTSDWGILGNNLWGNLERYIGTVSTNNDPHLLGSSPAWSPWGNGIPYDTYDAVGTSNWAGLGNNIWGNLERYIGTVSTNNDPHLLGSSPAWSPWGNGIPYDTYDAVGTSNWAGIGNNLWGNLGTYFGITNPNAVTTPTWNMLGEITSWDMLGTSNWAGSLNNIWGNLGTYFGTPYPDALTTNPWGFVPWQAYGQTGEGESAPDESSGSAQAETITRRGNIFKLYYDIEAGYNVDTQAGSSIDYWNFTVGGTGASTVKIDILSTEWDYDNGVAVDVNGDGEIAYIDSYIYLFNDDGSLDPSDLIASNDDNRDPLIPEVDGSITYFHDLGSWDSILEVSLEPGDYILAISDCNFTETSAVAGGINPDGDSIYTNDYDETDQGDYQIQFTGYNLEITGGPGTDIPIITTTITVTGSIFSVYDNGDPIGATIDYWSFTVNQAGLVKIDILSYEMSKWPNSVPVDVNGDGEIAFIDPYIYLFNDDGSLDESDYIASSQDEDSQHQSGPFGQVDGSIDVYDSYMSLVLEEGNYILAISDEWLFRASAVAGGINPDAYGPYTEDRELNDHGDYQIQFVGDITITGTP